MLAVAKMLHVQNKKYKIWGRNQIYALLRDVKILMDNGCNEPYQPYIDRGYFKQILVIKEDSYGKKRYMPTTLTSGKGLDFIRRTMDECIQITTDEQYNNEIEGI